MPSTSWLLKALGLDERDAEGFAETFDAPGCKGDRPAVLAALDPAKIEVSSAERRAEAAGKMRTPFAPVEAGAANGSRVFAVVVEIETEITEEAMTLLSDGGRPIGQDDEPPRAQPIGQGDGEPTGQMIVAGARC